MPSHTTGADAPDEITHCFVLKGFDLVWSMLEGEKVVEDGKPVAIRSKNIENRHVRMPPGYYGVIFGKSKSGLAKERYEQIKAKLPEMKIPPWSFKDSNDLAGNVVGVVQIAHSLPYDACTQSPWAEGPVCNVISKAGWIDEPIPCKGNLGACPIADPETRDRVRLAAKRAMEKGSILVTNGDVENPYRGADVWKRTRKRKGCFVPGDVDDDARLRKFITKCVASIEAKMSDGERESKPRL